jgi:phosphoglycerol transferase
MRLNSKAIFRKLNTRSLPNLLSVILVTVIPALVAFSKMGFNSNNLKFPLAFENDEILYATNVLSFLNGTPLRNLNFGAPLGQDLNFAFMSVDSGPILAAAILGKFGGSVFFGLNTYYLLTFSLSGLSGYIAARLLNSNHIFSVVAGLIIALPPFHYLWWTSGITVTSYFLLPVLFALTILRMQNLLSKGLFYLGLGISALNGAWYSYYSLGFVFLFGTFSILALASGYDKAKIFRILPFVLTNILTFVLVSIPALIAKSRSSGTDYFGERDPWGVIVSSTTLLHYILPYPGSIEDKLVSFFSNGNPNRSSVHFQSLLNQSGLFGEGWTGALPWGLLIVALVLNVSFLKFKMLSEFGQKNYQGNSEIISIIRSLTVVGVLWTLVGGFGTVFSVAISPILRGYARYSIFVIILISIFCAVGLSGLRSQPKADNRIKAFTLLLLTFVFILTPLGMFLNRSPVTAGSAISKVEATLMIESKLQAPRKCSILQLPIMHYPYEAPGYPTYRLLRFGLISDKYKWSSGAIGGSPAFLELEPLKNLQSSSLSRMLPLASGMGFCGILIDKQAWDSVANFKPWPEYNSGVIQFDKFLDQKNLQGGMERIESSEGSYIWIKLNTEDQRG